MNQRFLKDDLPGGFVEILKEECKGCGICVDACPREGLALSADINRRGHRYAVQTDPYRCTGCSQCYILCPGSAIVVYRRAKRAGANRKS